MLIESFSLPSMFRLRFVVSAKATISISSLPTAACYHLHGRDITEAARAAVSGKIQSPKCGVQVTLSQNGALWLADYLGWRDLIVMKKVWTFLKTSVATLVSYLSGRRGKSFSDIITLLFHSPIPRMEYSFQLNCHIDLRKRRSITCSKTTGINQWTSISNSAIHKPGRNERQRR